MKPVAVHSKWIQVMAVGACRDDAHTSPDSLPPLSLPLAPVTCVFLAIEHTAMPFLLPAVSHHVKGSSILQLIRNSLPRTLFLASMVILERPFTVLSLFYCVINLHL